MCFITAAINLLLLPSSTCKSRFRLAPVSFLLQHYIKKIFKHTAELKELYSNHPMPTT